MEETPTGIAEVLVPQVKEPMTSGTYQISLLHRYYDGNSLSTPEELGSAFGDSEWRRPKVVTQRLGNTANLEPIRSKSESKAIQDLWANLVYWMVEIGALLIALFVVFRSAYHFRKGVRSHFVGGEPFPSIGKYIGAQILVFVVGCYLGLQQAGLLLIALIIPVLFVVWPFQLVVYLMARAKSFVGQTPSV